MNTQEIISICAEKCFQNMFDSTKVYLTQRLDAILANKEIQQNNFETWLNSKADRFKAARKPVSMFLTVLVDDLEKGNLPSVTKIPAKSKDLLVRVGPLQDTESFETSVDEFLQMVPKSCARSFDDLNNLRGVFDGKGSFVYLDGTISKKYSRIEDLTEEDFQILRATIDAHHQGLPGHDELLQMLEGGRGG